MSNHEHDNIRRVFPTIQFEPVWASEPVNGATVCVERSQRFGKEQFVVRVHVKEAGDGKDVWSLPESFEGQGLGWAMETGSRIHRLLKLLGP